MSATELIVEAYYPLTCQKRRARSPKTILVKGSFPVSVPCLTPEEAPVALKIMELSTQRVGIRRSGPCGMIGATSAPQGINEVKRILAEGGSNQIFGVTFPDRFLAEELRKGHTRFDEVPLDIDLILKDGREEVADLITAELQDCLFVGEKLHRKRNIYPLFYSFRNEVIRHELYTGSGYDHLDLQTALWNRSFSFSCLEEEKAVEFGRFMAETISGTHRYDGESVLEILSVDTAATETHPYPDHYFNSRRAIRYILSSLNNAIDVMSPDAIRRLADLQPCFSR